MAITGNRFWQTKSKNKLNLKLSLRKKRINEKTTPTLIIMRFIKLLLSYVFVAVLLWYAFKWIVVINEGHGAIFVDMNYDGVTTYKDIFVRIFYPAGKVVLDAINPVLSSDFGKFFEFSAIAYSSKNITTFGILFYMPILPALIIIAAQVFFKLFRIEDDIFTADEDLDDLDKEDIDE